MAGTVHDLPLHFLVRSHTVPLLDQLVAEGVDAHATRFAEGPESWGLQTFVLAKRAGWPVTAGTSFRRGAVNVAHVTALEPFQSRARDLVVGIRADYKPSILADCHVVQNQLQAGPDAFWVPHWAQPGLIPRSPDRTRLTRVAYFGRPYYLAGGVASWRSRLQDLGVEFHCPPEDRWHDYSDVDLVIAIRSFDTYPYPRKPPSKLFNAWLAGCPALVGPESAYSQVGEPGRDYLVATSMDEAVEAVAALKRKPERYAGLVDGGRQRALQFTRERILGVWAELLEREIGPRWSRAQKGGMRRWVGWSGRQGAAGVRAVAGMWDRKIRGSRPISR